MTEFIRKNVGFIGVFLGFFLLIILLYGNILEIFSTEYWINVWENITSYTTLSFALTFVQFFMKQSMSEQALSRGLNTNETKKKYEEHKNRINKCKLKMIYIPYFLTFRNNRETKRRKNEFIANNNFMNEKALLESGNKKIIKNYNAIRTNITLSSIKWATTEIKYDKFGRITTLQEHRAKRAKNGLFASVFGMIFTSLIAGGLFFKQMEVNWWQSTVQLVSILFVMFMTSISGIIKEYEKGKFGVPNELDEINEIWDEFFDWSVPESVKKEVEESQQQNKVKVEKIDLEKMLKIDRPIKLLEYKQKEEPVNGKETKESTDARTIIYA